MKYFLIFAGMFAVVSVNVSGQNLRLRLLAEVTVHDETLRLSDLLPDDASLPLKTAADEVFLGRAPLAGSLRVFTGSELRQAMAKIRLRATAVDIPEQVVVRRLGWPVEPETVRRILAGSNLTHHLDFAGATIVLPPGFTTVASHPQFEVTALHPGSDHRDWFALMRCRERVMCGSFLAEIALSVPAGGVPAGTLQTAFAKANDSTLSSVNGPVLVRPGHLALLVIEGDGFRITEPVMPLRRGRLGELLRVSETSTHRSLVARVSGDGTLRTFGTTGREESR